MDAITMIKDRRSVRDFKKEKVDREILKDIISTATYSPSWANSQTVRYTVVDSEELLNQLAREGFNGFTHNINIVSKAAGAVIVSNLKGKSGCAPDGTYVTPKGTAWEMFDAGIACQTFCLAAYEKGVGTVILGIFDEEKIAEIVDLPQDETVSAVIAYGYEAQRPKAPKRKVVDEVARFM